MKNLKKVSTKKGVASLYVVIFATILFGVITLSFIRIILSESQQTSNDDLSQSAYDSAMAGVEDAKLAVNRFYKDYNAANIATLFGGSCDSEAGTFKLKKKLFPSSGAGEVKIQETSSGNGTEQAYTCVILKNVVDDYRSTLTSDNRTKVVPLGIGSSNKLQDVKKIRLSWYSEVNGINFKNMNNTNNKLKNKSTTSTPPVLSVTLLKTRGSINLDDFNNSTDPNYSSMVFLPTENEGSAAMNTFDTGVIGKNGNSDFSNAPYLVHCTQGGEFACTVELESGITGDIQNAMLVVSLPYGDTVTDFKVDLLNDRDEIIQFENVQVSVDSTGRANQLVRRVETRLDPSDLFFPYPEYEVELTGGDDESLLKNFWITYNCWTEGGSCDNNGSL